MATDRPVAGSSSDTAGTQFHSNRNHLFDIYVSNHLYLFGIYERNMKGTHLGEFEELILLMVGILKGEAYGISVMQEIEKQTGRTVTVSTIHTALYRLEEKGYVRSFVGGASKSRGGRSKRLYEITAEGREALELAKAQRDGLWNLLIQGQ